MFIGPAGVVIGIFLALRIHRILKSKGEQTTGWVVGVLFFWPLACAIYGYKYDDMWVLAAGILGLAVLTALLLGNILFR